MLHWRSHYNVIFSFFCCLLYLSWFLYQRNSHIQNVCFWLGKINDFHIISYEDKHSAIDSVILSLFTFSGYVCVALTGFGMAIIYMLLWKISVLDDYEISLIYSVLIQSLSLFSSQPFHVLKAQICKHASRWMSLYFVH